MDESSPDELRYGQTTKQARIAAARASGSSGATNSAFPGAEHVRDAESTAPLTRCLVVRVSKVLRIYWFALAANAISRWRTNPGNRPTVEPLRAARPRLDRSK